MASRYSNNGRTHPVGRSKSPISSRPSSKKKKTTSVKKFTSAKAISRDDDETMLSMLSAYTNSINRFEGSPRSKSPGREDPNDRLILLKSQLTDALEENAFVKSRLNAELKERHLMEAKYKELNKKFTESKKALQATGAALLQVHNQTSEMKNKRDEREIQLDEALSLNRNLNSKIAELESRLEQALLSNNTGTTTANLKKLIEDKESLIKSMEEQQVQLQSQMSKIRRDNYRLGEENAELQEALESKNRKIANLVKKVGVLEEELEAVGEVRRQISSRGRVTSPGGQASSRVDAKQLESRLINFEGDKKFLEERMAQLELSLKQSESVIQQIQGASQENSPAKASYGSQPSLAFNYTSSGGTGAYALTSISAAAPPPMTEKPSAPSPRKSPGVGSRPSIKASAGTNLLTPIPVESPLESSPPVHAKETSLQKHNALPSLGQATSSNGVLTDALFSSSSVIEVNKVPNAVLDKPASIPSAPIDIASPASSVSSKRSKRKKSSKERSEKSSSSSSASAAALATAAIAAATVATTVAAAPVTAATAASLPAATASLSSPTHMAAVTPSAPPPMESTAPTPVPAAPQPDPAPEPATATAPEPVAAPAPAPVVATTPATEPTTAPAAVTPSEPTNTAPALVATPVPAVSDAPTLGTSAPTSKNGSRSNSIRAPISREGRGTPSSASRRPASSKKTTEGTAHPSGASALMVEFGPSETIAGRYTEEGVDEMLKPEADVEVYKQRMLELRKRVKRDIYAWTKSFVNENQRQPNKQERKDVGGPMFKAYSGSQKILKDLGVDVSAESTKLGRGTSVKFSSDAD